MPLTANKRTARSRLRVVLLVVALLLTATGAATVYSHFHYPKTFRVVAKLDPPCDNLGPMRVGGHDWVGLGFGPNWSSPIPGKFKIISPHRAVLIADQGGQELFQLLPNDVGWNMQCTLP